VAKRHKLEEYRTGLIGSNEVNQYTASHRVTNV